MAVHEKMWMAGRVTGEGSYTVLGFSSDEQEAADLCEEKEDFVAVMSTGHTEVGAPHKGYYPLWVGDKGDKDA